MKSTKKYEKAFNKMMGNPLKEIDLLVEQADEFCKCGNRKMDESEFCKECI